MRTYFCTYCEEDFSDDEVMIDQDEGVRVYKCPSCKSALMVEET